MLDVTWIWIRQTIHDNILFFLSLFRSLILIESESLSHLHLMGFLHFIYCGHFPKSGIKKAGSFFFLVQSHWCGPIVCCPATSGDISAPLNSIVWDERDSSESLQLCIWNHTRTPQTTKLSLCCTKRCGVCLAFLEVPSAFSIWTWGSCKTLGGNRWYDSTEPVQIP